MKYLSLAIDCFHYLAILNIMPDISAFMNSANKGRFVWLDGYTKMIEKRHPGITYGYETEDNTWRIFSRTGTLLIQVGFDLENEYIVYKHLTDADGMVSKRTKDLGDLKLLLPKLEEINAFNR